MNFIEILKKYREISFSQRDKGARFERLMQAYLLTDPKYTKIIKEVNLWEEFHGKSEMGGKDTGIDLVAITHDNEYWAIQCKCYQENSHIDKPEIDTFLSTSSKEFFNLKNEKVRFSQRLWISTTNNWGPTATETIKNQNPPFTRINLTDLIEAPIDWEKLENGITGKGSLKSGKSILPHQQTALDKTIEYLKSNQRGKLIMACGTGKTYTSLKIAEKLTNNEGLILFLVPSIALLGQTLREWSFDAEFPINAICICSDPAISKKKTKNEDEDTFSIVDLAMPASTNVKNISQQFKYLQNKEPKEKGLTVVFSTYQSIDVISKTQSKLMGEGIIEEFDLIICDEAHRTTGVTLSGDDESAFTKVHNNEFIRANKRVYMTATPRLFDDDSKSKAAQYDAILCSMDDISLYGDEMYRIGFGEAVERELLSDYKVIIMTLADKHVPPSIQKMMANGELVIDTDDVTKLIGTISALSKQFFVESDKISENSESPMRRAVAFCPSIEKSKHTTETYNVITEKYKDSLGINRNNMVTTVSQHIDGTMSAPKRDELLTWLKAPIENNECKILTNVRCLSEGVDVPSLDAVLFLSARNSQIDVVQSVGRVMRLSPGKKYGYIIIPVVIPSDVNPVDALNDNNRFKVVWTVLNALRAHDDRFNAIVNKIELNKRKPDNIEIKEPPPFPDDIPDTEYVPTDKSEINQIQLKFSELKDIIYAKLVNKVGDRGYWEQWAKEVAVIAQRQIERMKHLIENKSNQKVQFDKFLNGLRKNINPSITQDQAIEMLSQHIITKPIFEALFEDYSFVKNNAVSVSMQIMLDSLEDDTNSKDLDVLQKFYENVKMKISKIDNAEGKQKIIIQVYDKFFKTAFPKMVEQLGIVYTPIEVVDFIIHSVDDILKQEFGRSLTDENVHILDPFTGTGTFITRIIQSGLIKQQDLARKYNYELHANEIVLLAYYIAAVNIENAFHDAMNYNGGNAEYQSFDGIVLTDTFQLGETDGNQTSTDTYFIQNTERVNKQKKSPITVIIGNPPYSVGQKSANDNAQNQKYSKLDSRIEQTYAKLTNAINKNSLYDSYFKAFRWSTDRLDKTGGIICFVTNSGWLDGNSADGFRKSLEKEFTAIYVLNLRGSIRGKSGISAKKEGQNVFDIMTGVAITLLVKNPDVKTEKATIHYHDIGDFLNRKEKIKIVSDFKTFANPQLPLKVIQPNEHGDWISVRNNLFAEFITIGNKDDEIANSFFNPIYSRGLATARDAWCYNSSVAEIRTNIKDLVEFYNKQRSDYFENKKLKSDLKVEGFLDFNSTRITWNRGLKNDLLRNKEITFNSSNIKVGLYRPFFKQKTYLSRDLNDMIYLLPKLLPNNDVSNILICLPGIGNTKDFGITITNVIPDLGLISACQCFPLYYYEENNTTQKGIFDEKNEKQYTRRDGVSDWILEKAKKQYGISINSTAISKEDIFYYVYGFLHSPEYRIKFANDLKKMLPRLPLVEDVKDFWAFSKAGRSLAELHINYESVAPYQDVIVTGEDKNNFKVIKMRNPKKGETSTIIYNSNITISNIPEKAYEYIVNGKSAINWIMERYQITTHKESGIKNDPNDWADEVGNPRYILDLLLSIINVSVQTVDIVNSLPKLSFEEKDEVS